MYTHDSTVLSFLSQPLPYYTLISPIKGAGWVTTKPYSFFCKGLVLFVPLIHKTQKSSPIHWFACLFESLSTSRPQSVWHRVNWLFLLFKNFWTSCFLLSRFIYMIPLYQNLVQLITCIAVVLSVRDRACSGMQNELIYLLLLVMHT